MLQLNVHLYSSGMPPPNRAIVIIRSAALSLKMVAKSLFQRVRGRRAADTEASAGEEKTTEKALEEYAGRAERELRELQHNADLD